MCFVVIVGYHTKCICDTFHACGNCFAHIVHTTILQAKKENSTTRMMMKKQLSCTCSAAEEQF